MAFPETGNHIVNGQGLGRMRVGVKVLKPKSVNNIEKYSCNGNSGNRMDIKENPAEFSPSGFFNFGNYGILIIGVGRDKGANKSQNHHEMAEVTYKGIDHNFRKI